MMFTEHCLSTVQALVLEVPSIDQLGGRKNQSKGPRLSPRSRIRDRWRRAIHEQILLNRLEAANQSLDGQWPQAQG